MFRRTPRHVVAALVLLAAVSPDARSQSPEPAQGGNRAPVFRSGVDVVHVTATVTDSRGHFVRGLRREDFRVVEDGVPQSVLQFSAERAPLSLGIALDTSSSMAGTKIREAKEALDRVVSDMLEPGDEVFLYTFGDVPTLRQRWTSDPRLLREALDSVAADGRTALFDTVQEALHLMQTARYPKRVLLVLSDGNDTASFTPLDRLRALIRESEAIVYGIAIDTSDRKPFDRRRDSYSPQLRPPQRPPSFPPRPPLGPRGPDPGRPPWAPPQNPNVPPPPSDAANVDALRELTDVSGGRTEIIRASSDIGPATASVADELSRQYQLAYQASTKRDGRWHVIEVSVTDPSMQVRARKGYVATRE
jgi:VWFA-related protein